MNGEHDKLRQTLGDLKNHLAELREVDPSVAAHLDATIAEAERALATEGRSAEHHTAAEQLKDAMQHYEASHPTLAGNLRSVVDALAQIGI